MSLSVFLISLGIVAARILDVSLGVLRTVCIFRNYQIAASFIGFFESLVWLLATAKVATNLDNPAYAIAFALGFALGTYIGLKIENKLALGNQVLRVFTKKSDEVLPALRAEGFRVTKFNGEGHTGSVDLLLLKLMRRGVSKTIEKIKALDGDAFYFIDDIGSASDSVPARRVSHFVGIRSLRK